MQRLVVLVVVLVLGVLAGCGPSQSGPGTPEPARDTPSASDSATPSDSASASASAAPVDVRRDDQQLGAAFTTPSGNITCFVESLEASGADGPSAGCRIARKSWTAPPSDCDLDYGSLIRVVGGDRAFFDCRGDIASCYSPVIAMPDLCGNDADSLWWHQPADGTVATADGAAAVLPYGSAIRIDRFQCTSLRTGVSCENAESGQGFRISRAAYALTP